MTGPSNNALHPTPFGGGIDGPGGAWSSGASGEKGSWLRRECCVMTLSELAFACFLYGRITDYDESYLRFVQSTANSPDLANPEHRQALLTWLNKWGCRQFALKYHQYASGEILSWYNEYAPTLIPRRKNLWELSDSELTAVSVAYESLAARIASYRKQKADPVAVHVGPTGASKILFAIRPQALPPWDEPIRKSLGYDTARHSYLSYLKDVKSTLEELALSCKEHGFQLVDLPKRLDRPDSTVPKLIDEYYWVTLTRKWSVPRPSTFERWAEWA